MGAREVRDLKQPQGPSLANRLTVLAGLTVLLLGAVWLAPAPARVQPAAAKDLGERVGPREAAAPHGALPDQTVLVSMAEARELTAPFALRPQAAAAAGIELALPQGSTVPGQPAHARVPFAIERNGSYRLWLRARWSDSCGNSVAWGLDEEEALRVAGNDQVYEAWHWVAAGEIELSAGTHTLTLMEREDGIALDQALLTTDLAYQPAGSWGREGTWTLRRAGDAFDRSPGHGLGGWRADGGEWQIAFSLDPNRIPNQYALVGKAPGSGARLWLDAPPWLGCVAEVNFYPTSDCKAGWIFDEGVPEALMRVGLRVSGGTTALTLEGADFGTQEIPLGEGLRAEQWHRFTVERWAWTLRVCLDGAEVFVTHRLAARLTRPGLFVAGGEASFDDVAIVERPWQAEDGGALKLPFDPAPDAAWSRVTTPEGGRVLEGRAGRLHIQWPGLQVRELWVEPAAGSAACEVLAPGLQALAQPGGPQVFRHTGADALPERVALTPAVGGTRLKRVAVCFDRPEESVARLGPYTFDRAQVEDPSDYLDFTAEEEAEIARSPDKEKLRRRAKTVPILGSEQSERSFWYRRAGSWKLADGALTGDGAGSEAVHALEVNGDLELRLKIKKLSGDAAAEVVLYAAPGAGTRIALGGADADAEMRVALPEGEAWHELSLSARDATLRVRLDGGATQSAPLKRDGGGEVALRISSGRMAFDDIELRRPRAAARSCAYDFQRRETDWWREGGPWLDHGGISCVLASSWISLLTPESTGRMWHKRAFEPDMLIACSAEEHTEWFGWDRHPSHVHHAFNDLELLLAPDFDAAKGYRLVVSAENHQATVLYRAGREVARVAQDEAFPIQYEGGHSPYRPRVNRLVLLKRGATLRALINGKQVLEFHDPEPISVRRAGLGGEKTRVNFSHVEVLEFAQEAEAGPGS